MRAISTAQILADLRDGRSANIEFVKGTGTTHRGERRTANVIHAFAYETFKKRTPIEVIRAREAKVSSKYAKRGIIPLVDTDTQRQLTVFISHIVKYDGKKVIH